MELLNVKELADRLNVPASQIYRQTELGRLPVVKVGRYHRYPWPKVLETLSNGSYTFGEEEEGEADDGK